VLFITRSGHRCGQWRQARGQADVVRPPQP